MITKTLFRKNYLIFASIVLFFIVMAILSSWLLTSYERNRMFMGPATMNQSLLEMFDEDPFKAILKLNEFANKAGMQPHDLINAQGLSVLTNQKVLHDFLSAEQIQHLQQNIPISLDKNNFPGPAQVITKTNKDGVYLFSHIGPPDKKRPLGPFITLAALITCVLISLGIALFYQLSKYRERSIEAFEILKSLREGNLSARLPLKKFDELLPLTQAFNEMANDLEAMVDQLRKSDNTRRQLLQDLAHDLRTPLTSLRTFLETLQTSSNKISADKIQEILALCFSEVEYFGKLVEDLLFLAQITEPKYSLGSERIDLKEKIQDQITIFKARYPSVQYHLQPRGTHFDILGSAQLLDRLLRNAFENSSSFAKSHLTIELCSDNDLITISLIDDGPGFSAKALTEFGYKKASRVLIGNEGGPRISVGIGSVIMKEIALLHFGTISAENLFRDNQVNGARVSISFKKS